MFTTSYWIIDPALAGIGPVVDQRYMAWGWEDIVHMLLRYLVHIPLYDDRLIAEQVVLHCRYCILQTVYNKCLTVWSFWPDTDLF